METQAKKLEFDYDIPAATPVQASPRPEAEWYRRLRLRAQQKRPVAQVFTVDEPVTDDTQLPPFAKYGGPPQPPPDDASAEEFDEWMRAATVYIRSYWAHNPPKKSVMRD